ncbi:MAG: hypothetical protein ACK5LN_13945 [Propioniciclava sp.]
MAVTHGDLRAASPGALVVLLGGGALVVAQEPTRRALIDIGLPTSTRIGLVSRWSALPSLSLFVSAVLLTPMIATRGWVGSVASMSWPWLVPYIVGILAALVIGWAYLQPPRSSPE